MTREETRAREERICRSCGYQVAGVLMQRCPRCFSLLPEATDECEGCVLQARCDETPDSIGTKDS